MKNWHYILIIVILLIAFILMRGSRKRALAALEKANAAAQKCSLEMETLKGFANVDPFLPFDPSGTIIL